MRTRIWTLMLPALATIISITGCEPREEDAADVRFGLSGDERLALYHEMELAILENERAGIEEHPGGGPECEEYIYCLDDESKEELATKYRITVAQVDEIIHEGDGKGWSQW